MDADIESTASEGVTVADVGPMTPGWLRDTTALATGHGLAGTESALRSLAAGRGRPAFRLAVLGGPGKGKSTLVNTLLGTPVMPTGSAGTTQSPVVICSGGDGWLERQRLELVDTPGFGATDQVEELHDTVAECDAVLFVVFAVAPLSNTELRILQEQVLGKHVPFVAVVVTMLDLVDPAEHADTIRHIESRLAETAGRVTILLGPGPGGDDTERDRLREFVAHHTRTADRPLWRNRRTAALVADHCTAMVSHANEQMAVQRRAAAEHEAATAQAMTLLDRDARQWEILRLELMSRQLTLTARLRDKVREHRGDLLEKLRWELEHAPDPRAWWDRSLPSHLRSELGSTARRVERLILSGLANDSQWLNEQIREWLPGATSSPRPRSLDLEVVSDLPGTVPDVTRARWAARIATQGSTIIGYSVAGKSVFTPILGTGFGLIGGLLAEASMRSATERQRREVDRLLVRAADDSVAALTEQCSSALAAAYAPVFDQLASNHLVWHQHRLAAIDPGEQPSQTDWPSLAKAAAELADTIRSALRG
jgi:GTP-binding protein EngB required for normal cell division